MTQAGGQAFTAECFLAQDEEGRQVVSVLHKRTFDIRPDGTLAPSEDPIDLVRTDEIEPKGDEPGYYPVSEIELLPYKLKTDVIVTGSVIAPRELPVRELLAGIRVGRFSKMLKVFGDRRIEGNGDGALRFSDPEPFVSLPLSYTLAYGGVDPSVPRNEDPQTVQEWMEYMTLECHPGVYPRNPVGRAYVVNPHAWLLKGRPLPNFEDPDDSLTPERVVVGEPENWWRQPMPAGLSWFGKNWYPRCVHGGFVPRFPPDEHAVREVGLGLLEPGHVTAASQRELGETVQREFFNGASPGLALPRLRGDETVHLFGLDPAGEIRFGLPGYLPRFQVFFQGDPLQTETQLHTVWIRKDENRVSMVWSGNARPPCMLPLTLPTREQPVVDELEGVEIRVDGVEVPHEALDLGAVPI